MPNSDEVILKFIENYLIDDQDFLLLYRNIVGEQKAWDATPANVYKELGFFLTFDVRTQIIYATDNPEKLALVKKYFLYRLFVHCCLRKVSKKFVSSDTKITYTAYSPQETLTFVVNEKQSLLTETSLLIHADRVADAAELKNSPRGRITALRLECVAFTDWLRLSDSTNSNYLSSPIEVNYFLEPIRKSGYIKLKDLTSTGIMKLLSGGN